MPARVCRRVRARRGRNARGRAFCGYGAAKHERLLSWRLHLIFDLPVMIAVAFAALPIFITGLSINRWEGALFLGYYVAYTAYLILAATEHDTLIVS